MSDDPFGDLDDMEQDADDAPEPESSTSESAGEPESVDEVDARDEPAFEFDVTKQRPLYARPEVWSEFDDAIDFEIRRMLKGQDVTNVEGREIHEAVLRIAAADPEAVVETVRELRGLDEE